MAYAPILDPSAFAGKGHWRKVSVAAASALQELAGGKADQLRDAIRLLDASEADDPLRHLIEGLPGVPKVVERTGVSMDELFLRLKDQLREVKAFGELDGGTIDPRRPDDYIGPVGRLIRSGRVELFAGKPSVGGP